MHFERSRAASCPLLRSIVPSAILGGAIVLTPRGHAAETLEFVPLAAVPLPGSHPVMNGQVSNGERFGRAVSGLGDVDGDGIPDLVVGSRSDGDGGTDAGAVYVILMNRDLSPREAIKIGAGAGGMPASEIAAGDFFGYGVAGIGDLDGDGVPDLAVTAPNAEPAGMPANANQGALFICLLQPDGSVREHVRLDSQDGLPLVVGDSFGQGLANLGDLDGDGRPDLGVGAPGADDGAMNAGAFFVVRVDAEGSLLGWDRFSRGTHPQWLPLEAVDNFGGRGSAAAGDLDGDGAIEVAVGCYRDDDGGADRGAVWLLSLAPRAKGGVALVRTTKISSTAGGFDGPVADGDLFGMTVAPLGDLDRDGVADLAVGNNLMDQGFPNSGGLFLLGLDAGGAVRTQSLIAQGGGFPDLSLLPGERFGRALANLGDVRGDGSVVLAVGAGAGVEGGRLWLVAIGSPRSGDLDGSGAVNGADLAALLAAWGGFGPADLDWSGSVDGGDLAQLLAAWK
ncbi:MAG: integrin alpha [Phycisphaerales bacterium]